MEREYRYEYGARGWQYHGGPRFTGIRHHRVSGPQETRKYDWVESVIPKNSEYLISHNFVVDGMGICYVHIIRDKNRQLVYRLQKLLGKM